MNHVTADPKKIAALAALREAALAALREAVKAKCAYWDAMDVLEKAFSFGIDVPDKVSNAMIYQIDNLASGCYSASDVERINEDALKSFMSACEVSL